MEVFDDPKYVAAGRTPRRDTATAHRRDFKVRLYKLWHRFDPLLS